jgi:tetratricopeptide (TPR) repeat protein
VRLFALLIVTAGVSGGSQTPQAKLNEVQPQASVNADAELKTGSELTRRGMFEKAIPHLIAAQAAGANRYASAFNLGICYLGLGNYKQAIVTLQALRSTGSDTAPVNNLLTQAYLGDGQRQRAWEAFERAASQAPGDEKLYAFVADACTDHQEYELGLRVADRGLQELPDSARLHYERAIFLGRLDRLEEAKPEFERVAALEPGSYVARLAQVQEDLYLDKYSEAIRLLREAIESGNGAADYQTFSLLGTVLLRQGTGPGDKQFEEARAALERSAREMPDYSATQIALGKLYGMEGRFQEAVEHLEIGRRMEPNNPEVYASLAHAYLRLGNRAKAHDCQVQLARLLTAKKQSSLTGDLK